MTSSPERPDLEAIEAIGRDHTMVVGSRVPRERCGACNHAWPCPTRMALDDLEDAVIERGKAEAERDDLGHQLDEALAESDNLTAYTERVEAERDAYKQLATDLADKLKSWHDREHPAEGWGRPCRSCIADREFLNFSTTDDLLARARSVLGEP